MLQYKMDAVIICIFKGMQWKRFKPWMIPLMLAVVIKIFSFFPGAVEKYYSSGIYPAISVYPRLLFGWIPFSIGDVLYTFVLFYLIISLIRFLSRAFKRTLHRQYMLLCLKRSFSIVLWVYLLFNIFWGLNYDRLPLAQQQQLDVRPYSKEELKTLVGLLVNRMNETDSASREARKDLVNNDSIFRNSVIAYQYAAKDHPALLYFYPSVKFSFYGYLANYLGFSGYYNPFTCEAQVNTTIPRFVQPFTTCHEIGHQLGYAKEEEANFCGFLATEIFSRSGIPLFGLYRFVPVFSECPIYTRFHGVYSLP